MHPLLARRRFESALQGLTEELCQMRQWTVIGREWPVIDLVFEAPARTPLRTRWVCDKWNAVPPSIELLEVDGAPVRHSLANPSSIFHAGPHPVTGKQFVCMAGSREYHIHESHLDADWDALRGLPRYRLLEIVTQVWNGWLKGDT